MSNPVTASFKHDFETLSGMIDKMIDVCPDALWNKKAGGFVFWQQLLHTLACVDFFAMRPGHTPQQIDQPAEVIHLKVAPTKNMSKAELKSLLANMKQVAFTFLDSLTHEQLFLRHEALAGFFGKEVNNLDAINKLLWHTAYHLGCCDALLREEGLTGVW